MTMKGKRIAAVLTLIVMVSLAIAHQSLSAETLKVFAVSWPTWDALKTGVPDFEKSSGAKVVVEEVPYADAYARLAMGLKAGQYDVVTLNGGWITTFGAANLLLPLDQYQKDRAFADYDWADFMPNIHIRYKKAIYTFPFEVGMYLNFYRKDLFEEKRLKYPTTYEEWAEVAQALTVDANGDGKIDVYGTILPGKPSPAMIDEFTMRLWTFGGELWNDDGKAIWDSPAGVKAIQNMVDWVNKYKFLPPGFWEYNETGSLFLEGRLATTTCWSFLPTQADKADQSRVVGKWVPAPRPGVTQYGVWGLAIARSTGNKDLALAFARHLTGKEHLKKMAFSGIPTTRRSAMEQPGLPEWLRVVVPKQLAQGARLQERPPQWEQIRAELQVELQRALKQEITAKEAATRSAAAANKILGK